MMIREDSSYCSWPFALLLFGIISLTYSPSLFCGFIWDDDVGIVLNENLRTFEGLKRIWTEPSHTPQGHYWPMVDTSFWLEFQVWELNPFGYHLTNLLLQGLNACLLWRLLQRIEVPGAGWVALLFGVHPLQVESVAWIIERKNLLAGLFLFSSTLAYLRFQESSSIRTYALSLLLFILGMLSKSTLFCLPFLLAALVYWTSPGWKGERFVPLVPFFLIGAGVAWWDVSLVQQREVIEHGLSWMDRCVVAGRAFWFYLFKLLFPSDLVAVYPKWEVASFSSLDLLWPISVVGVGGFLLYRSRRSGKSPWVAFLAYLICLGPTIGFIDFGFMALSFVADRFAYFAVIPVFGLLVGGATGLYRSSRQKRFWQILFATLFFALILLSAKQCLVYRNQESLVRHNLDRYPEAWIVRYNFAIDLASLGRTEEAIDQYRQVLDRQPGFLDARNNLGVLLIKTGKDSLARNQFQKILESEPNHPRAHQNLGFLSAKDRDWESAFAHYRRVLEVEPNNSEVLKSLQEVGRRREGGNQP